jgi:hypothetical protein
MVERTGAVQGFSQVERPKGPGFLGRLLFHLTPSHSDSVNIRSINAAGS